MNYDAFISGFVIALLAIMVSWVIGHWAKTKLERWGNDLTRETHNRLQDASLKLDTIQHTQERLLSRLDHLDRSTEAQLSKINEVYAYLSPPKSAA